MSKHSIAKLVILLALVSGLASCAAPTPAGKPALKLTPEQEAWLKQAELGQFEPKTFNQDELVKKATAEGKVTIYSYSSRVAAFKDTFMKQYPGIQAEGFDMDSNAILTKVKAEQQAKNYNADVIFMSNLANAVYELRDKGLAWNYIPPPIKDKLPKEYQDPMVHHLGISCIMYNNEVYKESPIKNLWDLTKPEWKGKVIFPDPLKLPEYDEFLVSIVEHADEMAQAYQQAFGEPLKLSAGVPNAGYEWILRLLKNDVVLVGSANDVPKAVGGPGQTKPPVGIGAYSHMRLKETEKLYFDVALNVVPVMGSSQYIITMIANQAPHPNAAKLMIQWMMGDEKAGLGYAPYNILGQIPARTDQPMPKGSAPREQMKLWSPSADFVWNNTPKIHEFWLANLKK